MGAQDWIESCHRIERVKELEVKLAKIRAAVKEWKRDGLYLLDGSAGGAEISVGETIIECGDAIEKIIEEGNG